MRSFVSKRKLNLDNSLCFVLFDFICFLIEKVKKQTGNHISDNQNQNTMKKNNLYQLNSIELYMLTILIVEI